MTTATPPRRIISPVATASPADPCSSGSSPRSGSASSRLAALRRDRRYQPGPRPPAYRIAGVELGGSTRRSGGPPGRRASVEHTGAATIVAGDVEETVAYADLGRRYEIDAMLDAAFGVGRKGGASPTVHRVAVLVRQASLPVLVHAYDAEALDAQPPSAWPAREHPSGGGPRRPRRLRRSGCRGRTPAPGRCGSHRDRLRPRHDEPRRRPSRAGGGDRWSRS